MGVGEVRTCIIRRSVGRVLITAFSSLGGPEVDARKEFVEELIRELLLPSGMGFNGHGIRF